MISGFGKFCVKKKRERRGRNPATGKDMMMRQKKVVTFKWSGKLKEKLNTKPKTKKRRVKSIKKYGTLICHRIILRDKNGLRYELYI